MDEGKKSRKKKRALTIEDLFTSVSTVKAYNDFPAPPRYVLSPRSAEACLREGIDPEQLRIRDLDSFWEPGIDASRQGMRHEVYSERRHSIMKSLRKARTAIINADVAKQRRGGKATSSIAAQMKAEEAKKESTMMKPMQVVHLPLTAPPRAPPSRPRPERGPRRGPTVQPAL